MQTIRHSRWPVPRSLSAETAPAACSALIMRKAITQSLTAASIRQRHGALGSRPLRLAHHLHLEDWAELCRLRLDPFQ